MYIIHGLYTLALLFRVIFATPLTQHSTLKLLYDITFFSNSHCDIKEISQIVHRVKDVIPQTCTAIWNPSAANIQSARISINSMVDFNKAGMLLVQVYTVDTCGAGEDDPVQQYFKTPGDCISDERGMKMFSVGNFP
jgi:hypothetical protein